MNELMTQPPQAEVNAQFDMMAQQMANDGLLEAVMAMQNIDMTSDSLMQDAAVAVGQANLATASVTEDVERNMQAQAAAAQAEAVRASVDALFSDDDENELANA
jgi:hypothetical protein